MKKKLLVFAALLVLALAVASIAAAGDVPNGAVVAWGDLDSITTVAGHAKPEDVDWTITDPTCTEAGRAVFTCTVGDTTHDHYVTIAPLGHLWSSETGMNAWGRTVVEPTCTNAGYAIDVCLRWGCGAENPDKTRPIEERAHEYDEKHYDVVKAPSCGEDGEGLGWKTCIWCGVRHPDTTGATDGTAGEHLVILPKVAHSWSDWRVDRESTCYSFGEAARTCIACGAVQHLYDGQDVVDQGETITIGDILPRLNEAWNVNGDALVGHDPYDELQDLINDLTDLKFEYEIKRDLLVNCGLRELTITCPYCHGYYHNDFKVFLTENAHDWNEERDPYASVPAWCTTDGYDIFYCKFDAVHGHDEEGEYKKVVTKAVGHDWSEWAPAEVFTKDGKQYAVSFRSCNRCGASEQKTAEIDTNGKKQGLGQDENGVWAYYIDDEIATGVTRLIPFQGGEFWVVDGYVATDANGLTICPDGKAYFLAAGQVQRVTQWAEYDGEWFIIADGLLNPVTGLKEYDGATFAVESGRKLHVDGLWCDPVTGTWVYCADGMVDTSFSGEVKYDGATFTVVNGYLVV